MSIKFKIGALTDVGLVRTNNEDNYVIIPDLTAASAGSDASRTYDLGANGALMVVADGMGGMNAGEVASETAINSIKASFSASRITPEALKSDASIAQFMNNAISAADAKIKAAAMLNPESQGMGTTIVVAWILKDKLYVSWCGDSRAYVFNSLGLHQITKDHSYVQSLVDKGEITREQAFDYPQSNVITRSLCDATGPAEPEALFKPYPLANGDTVILCTDGVSGMLRDNELENVIGSSPDDLDSLMASIKAAVQKAGAADNFTMCIAQIEDGALAEADAAYFKVTDNMLNGVSASSANQPKKAKEKAAWKLFAAIAAGAIVIALILTLIFSGKGDTAQAEPEEPATEQSETQETPAPSQSAPSKPQATAPAKPAAQQPAKTPAAKSDEGSGIINALTTQPAKTESEAAEPQKTNPLTNAINSGNKVTAPANPQKPAETPVQPSPDSKPSNVPPVQPSVLK